MLIYGTAAEIAYARRVFDGARFRAGSVPPDAAQLHFVIIPSHSESSGSTSVADGAASPHDRLMSRDEVAELAGVSASTVSRAAKAGRIEQRGRRYTATSVRRWLAGEVA